MKTRRSLSTSSLPQGCNKVRRAHEGVKGFIPAGLHFHFHSHPLQGERPMETNEVHRGRLVDHVQLVVADLAASRKFYAAVMDVLDIPMGGDGDGFFWADELVVST